MTIIKTQEVPYLKKEVLELYNNVTIVSTEGVFIKMNALILCATSQSLKSGFHEEDDEHTIITEFSLEELKQAKEFCMRGSCDIMAESILKAFGLLTITKINFENIDEKNDQADKLEFQSAMDTLENSLVVKDETIDIKHEPLEDLELDSNLEYSSDELPISPVLKKRGTYIFLSKGPDHIQVNCR